MMLTKSIKSVINLLVSGLLLIYACSDSVNTGEKIYPVEGKVIFNFYEINVHSIKQPLIMLSLQTEKIYGSTGCHILGMLQQFGKDLKLELYGINEGVGIPVFSPASWNSILNLTNREYSINFIYCFKPY